MADLVPVRRALLSVSDKTLLREFATALHAEFGVELISTGGTARFLRDLGLPVTDISSVTGMPEMMDGRVKTLHPAVHGGILAIRDNPEHQQAMSAHKIGPIDLVCVNLYPFQKVVSAPNSTFHDAIENIDIGGPAMIRSAAKNHAWVLVVTSPDRYEKVLGDLRKHAGSTCAKHRLAQAQRAFAHTAAYDTAIAQFLQRQTDTAPASAGVSGGILPERLSLQLVRDRQLRYGENPHQAAAVYVAENASPRSLVRATQHHGKELSYTNLLDADAANGCVAEFDLPAACIVKHATPCGAAIGENLAEAFRKAYDCDPVAAFGGIVALNRPVDAETAATIVDGNKLLEVILSPGYAPDALELLRSRWKNVRLLEVPPTSACGALSIRTIDGGFLVQEPDCVIEDVSAWRPAGRIAPSSGQLADLVVAWKVCKHVKSNAIVLCRDGATVGIGGGAVDRVGAARVAIAKALERARGAVCASDAFFPFPDGPLALIEAGVTAIAHPGGSVRDHETIELCDQRGVSVVLTGRRHFRH
jgi:phosphoribosylaminoimidazolecarboxamide formyltransferase/IMP cyclohydrolase